MSKLALKHGYVDVKCEMREMHVKAKILEAAHQLRSLRTSAPISCLLTLLECLFLILESNNRRFQKEEGLGKSHGEIIYGDKSWIEDTCPF